MEYFLKGQEMQQMLQTEMLATGNLDLKKLRVPVEGFINNFSQLVWLYDAETLNFLAINQEVVAHKGFENQQELEGKDLFDLEKRDREKHAIPSLSYAHRSVKELENVLSKGIPLICAQQGQALTADGYCKVSSTMRTPVFYGDNKKIKGILTINTGITKYVHPETLYEYYKKTYLDDMKKGNRLFMEYLGLPTSEFILTDREIEVLITLSKHRTNISASRELNLSESTIATYISNIKNRLQNQNLDDILLHFTTIDKRRF